jgi:S1-C subfamily serine protease
MSNNVLVELSDALASAAEQAGGATVLVNARRRLPGSGVVYAADSILTADHILEREEDITVLMADGTEIPAKLAGRDPGSDLALLHLDHPTSTSATPAPEGARIGQLALVLGRPSAEGLQASLGVVSAIGGPLRTGGGGMLERYIRTDAISYPGFSGGPLVDASGRVLGINTSGLARGMPLTIPAAVAWQVAGSLAAHGHIRRAYLGIRSQPVEIPAATQKGLKREQAVGLLIVGVETDSPASSGDLIVGDILVGISGSPVTNHDELYSQLNEDRIGKPTPVEILRAGQPKVVKVTVGERKP